MKEATFYDMLEKIEGATLPTGMGTYYPTAEELQESVTNHPLEELLPVLLFYASDPFKDVLDDEEYRKTVKLAKTLSGKIPLE